MSFTIASKVCGQEKEALFYKKSIWRYRKIEKKQQIEKNILKLAEGILSPSIVDRFLIERRRRINDITEYYPYAMFISKKKSKKKYCIVRYAVPTMELMAAGLQYVFCYYQLLERGYVPIIDIEFAYSYRQGRVGESNIWDVCFKQTISAKEAALQPYVLAAGTLFTYSDDPRICMDLNNNAEDHFIHVKKDNFKNYYAKAKKYAEPIWQIRDELLEELDKEIWNKLSGYRILGVFLRENFSEDVSYQDKADKEVYSRHPLLPGVWEVIKIIKEQLPTWRYDYIYLSTMYKDSVQLFRKEFGDKVTCIERKRSDISIPIRENLGENEKQIYEINQPWQLEREEMAKKYLKELVLLSRCNYLVGGASSGMAAALTMNGGMYDDIYILEDKRKIERY